MITNPNEDTSRSDAPMEPFSGGSPANGSGFSRDQISHPHDDSHYRHQDPSSLESLGKDKRVEMKDKRLVNCNTVDVNQLVPIKYKWAWEHYTNGCANNWLPTEVQMTRDIELWKSNELSEDERRVIRLNLGFFSTAESLVGNNIVLSIFRHVTNPEARQYLLRQAFEEAVHTHTFLYICQSLGLDEREIFNAYNEMPSIRAKDDFQMRITSGVLAPDFSTHTLSGLQEFLKNLVGYYIIMEGIFFYSGFVMILSFHRQNKMTGIGEQYQYILRDETIHLNFGIDLINGIKEENPEVWDALLQKEIYEIVDQAVELEIAYAKDCLPRGILGLKANMFIDYVRHIADRRLERIGLAPVYHSRNPFPWMSETIDLNKEKNFFETRVTEYQHAATLTW